MSQDLFQAPDYYQLDELLTEENILVRNAAREWVKREVSPIIEEAAQNAKFPKSIICTLGRLINFIFPKNRFLILTICKLKR